MIAIVTNTARWLCIGASEESTMNAVVDHVPEKTCQLIVTLKARKEEREEKKDTQKGRETYTHTHKQIEIERKRKRGKVKERR